MPKKLWLPNNYSTSKNLGSEETKPFLNEGLVYFFRYNDFSNPELPIHTHTLQLYIDKTGRRKALCFSHLYEGPSVCVL